MVGVSLAVAARAGVVVPRPPTPKTQSFLYPSPPPPASLSLSSTAPNSRFRILAYSGGSAPVLERVVSAATYSLPFFNSLQYGRHLFVQYPAAAAALLDPLLPLLSLYRSVPYASFVTFFAVYLGVVRNPALSRYVRFNAMQALTLDVLLVVPLLLTRILNPGRSALASRLVLWGHSAVFVFSCLCFLYALLASVVGKTPYLPFVADAASRQIL